VVQRRHITTLPFAEPTVSAVGRAPPFVPFAVDTIGSSGEPRIDRT
jgi:hypothetical protein